MRQYRYVSVDSHLEVSPDQWRDFVDPAFRDQVPRVVKLDNGGDAWKLPGEGPLVPLGLNFSAGRGWPNLRPTGVSYSEGLVGAGDGRQRLAEMDRDGIDAEILFPAVAGQRALKNRISDDAYVALARGYNDWLSSAYCAADYDRLLGAALLPVTCVRDAVDELRRAARLPGIRTVVLHDWPNGSGAPSDEDDRFWRAALETGLPLSAHVSFGEGAEGDRRKAAEAGNLNFAPPAALLTRVGGDTAYTITQLILAGVLDRFPALRLAFAECGAGWVPTYAEQADTNYQRHRFWAGLELPHPPSWYVRRHFLFGIQDDFFAVKCRHDVGVENIAWSTDFPHVATDWPDSLELIERMFHDVPADERHQMVCGNAVRFYRLDADAAARPAAAGA
jgi:predicted TIM-barrel fold metal-dependent hydrolase